MTSATERDQLVTYIRLELYNRGGRCGPAAIVARMRDLGVPDIPPERTIARILARNGLTHRRTGNYPGENTM